MQNFRKKLKLILAKKSVINKKVIAIMLILNILSIFPCYGMITDDFAETTLDKNLKIKLYKPKIYRDDFAENNKQIINKTVYTKKNYYDEFAEANHKVARHSVQKNIIFETNNTKNIELRIVRPISTKSKPEEGSSVDFVTAKDVKINNKLYPAGTPVKARIETVSQNSIWGVPADLIIGNFYIGDLPLKGEIKKSGVNNTMWVKPLSIAVGILAGAGFALLFIRGGHAKIKPDEVFTVSF